MKKLLAISLALVLGASMSFAQTKVATKKEATPKKEMVKLEKKSDKVAHKCAKAEGQKCEKAEMKCAKVEGKKCEKADMKCAKIEGQKCEKEMKCEKAEGHKCAKGEGPECAKACADKKAKDCEKKCEKEAKKQCCKADCDMTSPHCAKCGTADQQCGDCKDCAKK